MAKGNNPRKKEAKKPKKDKSKEKTSLAAGAGNPPLTIGGKKMK